MSVDLELNISVKTSHYRPVAPLCLNFLKRKVMEMFYFLNVNNYVRTHNHYALLLGRHVSTNTIRRLEQDKKQSSIQSAG